MSNIEFGDDTPDDAYDPDDKDVDWRQVEKVRRQIDRIQSIDNDDERLEAAKAWAAELNG